MLSVRLCEGVPIPFVSKSYANFIDDCLGCEYNLLGHSTEATLQCLGKSKIGLYEEYFAIESVEKSKEEIPVG